MKNFNVRWSKSVRLISAITAILLVGACLIAISEGNEWWNYMLVAVIALSVIYAAAMSPLMITLHDDRIVIHKIIGRKTILFEKIAELVPYKANASHTVRLLGSGGFLGYTGLFYDRQIGRYTSYVGSYDKDQLVLICTGGGMKYLISCENAQELISTYNNYVSK